MRLGALVCLLLLAGCGRTTPPPQPLDPEIASLIHDLVDGTDYEKRLAAHDTLPRHGSAVVLPLADALDRSDVDATIGAWIAEVLGSMPEYARPAAPALARRLMVGGDCSTTTAWALEQIGPSSAPLLAKALGSPHAKTRIGASNALLNLEGGAAPAAEALLAALEDVQLEVRLNAVEAMAYLPSVAGRAVPKLMTLTRERESRLRYAAGVSLAAMGQQDGSVQGRLRKMVLSDEDDLVRSGVLDAIESGLGRDEASLAFLQAVAASGDAEHGAPRAARMLLLERGVDEPDLVAWLASVAPNEAFASLLERAATLTKAGPNGRTAAQAAR